ncbi:MAG: hypothetical protein H6855_00365 [Rhodospirillales bacterium]|nr:hypothetical protein [Rhodospirillales bacterium]MCB9964521.1 hypothetical protein [Rhodospirillales bacterium]MCB9973794.1 hypothetical protein [Rhodospirillales bacterium]MCB9980322.1 hypothetical protein [Rhodospirillales bacterium]
MTQNTGIEPKIIKASYILQAKVGTGTIDPQKIHESQRVIDNNRVDFVPVGLEFLDELEKILKEAKMQAIVNSAELRERLTQPIMQLKGNAGMFKYNLIGDLANIMLSFLEALQEVDTDAFEIVEAHHKTLKAIILKRIMGDGGPHGIAFRNELKDACRRYFIKRDISIPALLAATT